MDIADLDDGTEDRRALLAFLREEGCTLEEMLAAHADGRLFALAGDRMVGSPVTAKRAEVRAAAHLDDADLSSLWDALGFPRRGDEAFATEPELEALRTFGVLAATLGLEAAVTLARAMRTAAWRVAEVVVTIAQGEPDGATALTGSETVTAQAYRRLVGALFPPAASYPVVLRHRIDAVRVHAEQSGAYEESLRGHVRHAVAFVDLSGFTTLSADLGLDDVSRLLVAFEQRVEDAIGAVGGRVVKYIGDEGMLIAPTGDALAEAVTALTSTRLDTPVGPVTARCGMAAGEMIARDGDYFGSVVNLAARLTASAEPGTVLASDACAAALDGGRWRIDALPPRTVRGLTEPVATYRVTPRQPRR